MFSNSTKQLVFILLYLVVYGSEDLSAGLLMESHGNISFAPYVSGIRATDDLYPGYKAEFIAHVDFFRQNDFILFGMLGNITDISKSPESIFTLHKIRYLLRPGIRYERQNWLITCSYNHESVHSISIIDIKGIYSWQNTVRLGIGTKGAHHLFLPDKYRHIEPGFINSFDAQINFGVFLRGKESIWVMKNHEYVYEEFGRLRYHLGYFRDWIYFTSIYQHLWVKKNNETELKANFTINAFRKAKINLFGIFYTYTFYDTYEKDNENKYGLFGFRVIF